ncbi:ABC transporter permease [Microbacterium sp.]|uniref:ABC transporter permease n=1 Tax=Microbacterium sp. TaxID=51671 RepID=UPI003C7786DC
MTAIASQTGALRPASWPVAVSLHTGRLLRRWMRSPALLTMTILMPVMMMLTVVIMFRGTIEQFSGAPIDLTKIAVMISVSSMLTGALMGAGSTVQERQEGLADRLRSIPGHSSASFAGRILAESLRGYLAAPITLLIALAYGTDLGPASGALRMLGVLALVAIASGAFGVMMGYLAETPQGAVAASPIVMVAMFFNTAMMPRDLYAPALRPLVDASPITAVANLTSDALEGVVDTGHIALFAAWFGGLTLLSVVVVVRRSRREAA